ncbi:MAG: hydrolase, partial [Dysgonamonadaceae bacterium]
MRIRTRYFVPVIFITSILLVAYAFPRQGKFKYSFSEGKPWQSGLLTAPSDFSIYKPADQLKAEQDSLLLFFEPYYNVDNNVKKESMAELDADISTNPKFIELPQNYKLYIRDKISKVYDEGIMRSEDYDNITASITQSFRIKDGKKAETKNIRDFHTIKSAYQKVIDDRPVSIDENVLRSIDLNNYIKENIVFDESTTAKAKDDFIHNVLPTSGMVQQGQRIIDEGEIVDANTYNILLSLKKVTEEKSGGSERSIWVILGQLIMITILFGMFYLYLLFFRPNEYYNRKHLIFMILLIDIFVLLTALTIRFDLFSVYIIPYAIVT